MGSKLAAYRLAIHKLRKRIDERLSQMNLLSQLAKPYPPQNNAEIALKITSTQGLVKNLLGSIFHYRQVVEDIYCQAEGCHHKYQTLSEVDATPVWHRLLATHIWVLSAVSRIYFIIPKSDNAQCLSYCFHEIIKIIKILSYVTIEYEMDSEDEVNNISIMGIEMIEFDESDFLPRPPDELALTDAQAQLASDPLVKDIVIPTDKTSVDILVEICRRYQNPDNQAVFRRVFSDSKNLRNFMFTLFNCRLNIVNEVLYKAPDTNELIAMIFAKTILILNSSFADKAEKAETIRELLRNIASQAEEFFQSNRNERKEIKWRMLSEINFHLITEYLFATNIKKQAQVDALLLKSDVFFKKFVQKVALLKFEDVESSERGDETRSRGGGQDEGFMPMFQNDEVRYKAGFFCDNEKCDENFWCNIYCRNTRIDILDAVGRLAERHFGQSPVVSKKLSHLARFCPRGPKTIIKKRKIIQNDEYMKCSPPKVNNKPPLIRSSVHNLLKLFNPQDDDLEELDLEELLDKLYKESLDKTNLKLKFAAINTIEGEGSSDLYEGEGINPMLHVDINPCPPDRDPTNEKDLFQLCFLERYIERLSNILKSTEDVKTKMALWKQDKGKSVTTEATKGQKGGYNTLCEEYEVYRKPVLNSTCLCPTKAYQDEVEKRLRKSYSLGNEAVDGNVCITTSVPSTSRAYSNVVQLLRNIEDGMYNNVEGDRAASGVSDNETLRFKVFQLDDALHANNVTSEMNYPKLDELENLSFDDLQDMLSSPFSSEGFSQFAIN